jgi:hypothetical protein
MPRPWGILVAHGLIMAQYLYAVAGVRAFRRGNIGPVLIDIERSIHEPGYRGVAMNDPSEEGGEWVYLSPMSWHPGGGKSLWPELLRGSNARGEHGKIRLRKAELLDYAPKPPIPAVKDPELIEKIPYTESGKRLHSVPDVRVKGKIAGKVSGRAEYRRRGIKYIQMAMGLIEAKYVNYSDDGKTFWNGFEKTKFSFFSETVYEADLAMSGEEQGAMKLRVTFSKIAGLKGFALPKLLFGEARDGKPKSYGYAKYKAASSPEVTLNLEDMSE